jgi:hypothetical protein
VPEKNHHQRLALEIGKPDSGSVGTKERAIGDFFTQLQWHDFSGMEIR